LVTSLRVRKQKVEIKSSNGARISSENWGTTQHGIPYGSIL